jgi:leucyl aminopeptidase
MTDFSALLQADKGQPATSLHLVDKAGYEAWLKAKPERVRSALAAQGFKGEGFQLAIVPGEKADWSAVLGVANVAELSPWCLAKAAEALPEGTYRVEGQGPGPAVLGWLLGQYRFGRYKAEENGKGPRLLLTDEPARIAEAALLAEASFLVRDLVNLPAQDLGPAELQEAFALVAEEAGVKPFVTSGDRLAADYPMIHAVGRAASKERAPRLLELEWGNPKHPRVAIVGGAAHALGLALLIVKSRLPVRLHLLIPAVENAISGNAFRPGDILKSRKGLTVEIGNTDAEGRLILADAITKAVEGEPELLIDFATLTGAARVALGPDLPALFANDDALAADLLSGGEATSDPIWRMPLWKAYNELFASDIADFSNASESPFAGAVTAALFLQKFVPDTLPWAHFDTFAWRAAAKPGRPKGGDALGLRATWAALQARYGGETKTAQSASK